MKAFSVSGGRLLKVTLLFTAVCLITIAVQATFLKMAMNQVYEITTMPLEEGQVRPDVPSFYTMIIPALTPTSIITALSAVIIAVVARYGIREGTKNIGDGMKYKSEVSVTSDTITTSEEISK